MRISHIPEFATKYGLTSAVTDLLHEIEVRSSTLTETLHTSSIRFGVSAVEPAPTLRVEANKIRVTLLSRFIEFPPTLNPEDQLRCGPCLLEFKATMMSRRDAIDYLMMREVPQPEARRRWNE